MSRRSRWTSTLLAFGAAACTIYNESLLRDAPDADASAGGSAGTAGGSGGAAGGGAGSAGTSGGAGSAGSAGIDASDGGCQHETYPPPPTGAGAPGGSQSFIVAMSAISFGDKSAADGGQPFFETIGFDLDGLCSPEEGESCTRPSWATAPAGDGPGGIDNAMGAMINQISTTLINNFGTKPYNEQLHDGKFSIIMRIRDWNGEANDDQVTGDIYIAAAYDSFGQSGKPRFDGTDVWPIASDSLKPIPLDGGGVTYSVDQPAYSDELAYVNDYRFVANFPSFGLRIPTGLSGLATTDLVVTLSGAFTVCEAEQMDGEWRFTRCRLGGRWKSKDVVALLGRFPNPLDPGSFLCTNTTSYGPIRNSICDFVDILGGLGGPTSQCDALSLGLEFQTVPASIGNVYVVQPLADTCPPEFDPKNDDCGQPLPDAGATGGSGGASGAGGGGGGGAAGTGGASGGAAGAGGTGDASGGMSGGPSGAAGMDASAE